MSIEPQPVTPQLQRGGHESPEDGLCFMEYVAFVRGIPHTDRPPCVSPVLGEMGRSLNDALDDNPRQLLIPLEPLMPGTAGDGHDETRSYMALDWLIRTWLPTWLELSPACRSDAARIRAIDDVDLISAERAGPLVRESSDHAAVAWHAAWESGVAKDTAWVATGDAAWAAARGAARDGDGDWAAVWTAARDTAKDTAWPAPGDAVAATAAQLQTSAIDLYRRMAICGRDNSEDGLQ